MIRTAKPKSAAGKRALKKKAPQVSESIKSGLFIRGSTTSDIVHTALKDLYSLKKPNAVLFSKKNDIHPFDNPQPIEFFADRNDAALFCIATHSKKRPHNLIFVRTFDYRVLDMVELGLDWFTPMAEIMGEKASVSSRPLMIFQGDLFETNETYKQIRSLFLDFFRGEVADQVNLKGLEYVITLTASSVDGKIYFRTYNTQMKKSGTKLPRVELEDMGPSMDFTLRRSTFAPDDVRKEAMKVPKVLKPTKVKNIEYDPIGDKLGRIHLGKQDLNKMQTRKMKGLKRSKSLVESETQKEGEIQKGDRGGRLKKRKNGDQEE